MVHGATLESREPMTVTARRRPRYATLRRGRRRLAKQTLDETERRARKVEDASFAYKAALAAAMSSAFRRLGVDVNTVFGTRAAAGDTEEALGALAIAEIREQLFDEVAEIMADSINAGGTRAAQVWTEFDLGFEGRTEGVLRMARQRSSTLVTNITDNTREAIRIAIQMGQERGDHPTIAARSIRPLVGNLPRHVVAVERYRNKLIDAGRFSRAKIDSLASKYSGRLLKHRTEMIARTEMLWASNAAHHEYWLQLRSVGLIPAGSARIWVTNPDDRLCEQCAPMDGALVSLDTDFVSSELALPGQETRDRPGGPVTVDFPPLHPMCRCTVALDPDSVGVRTHPGNADLTDVMEDLKAQARAAEPEATRVFKEQAEKFGGRMEGLDYKFKGDGSLTRKMRGHMRENPLLSPQQVGDKINDALRYTMVLDDAAYSAGAKAVISELEGLDWQQLEIKKYWTGKGTYAGTNAVFLSPQGAKVELQFHTPTSIDIKEKILHPLYERSRVLPLSSPERLRISEQMIEAAQGVPIPTGVDTIPGYFKVKKFLERVRRMGRPTPRVTRGPPAR